MKRLTVCAVLALGSGWAVELGEYPLAGGAISKPVDTAAIRPGEGKELVGRITNRTGAPIDSVTISVRRQGTATPPTSNGTTTVRREPDLDRSVANVRTDEGFTSYVPLGEILPYSRSVKLGIDVTNVGDGTTVTVDVAPSVADKPNGSRRGADRLASVELSEDALRAESIAGLPSHDRVALFVTNRGEEDIESFSGACTLPADVDVIAVHVQDPSKAYRSVPARVSIENDAFEITGLAPLGPETTYEVVIVLSAVPPSEYKVELAVER